MSCTNGKSLVCNVLPIEFFIAETLGVSWVFEAEVVEENKQAEDSGNANVIA